jgi:hypothetical protein
MKQSIIALLAIHCLLLAGCSKKLEGSYKWTGEVIGVPMQNTYDFNADGSVVWTTGLHDRIRGTYVVKGTKVLLTFPSDTAALVREGDVLMRGESRFVRQ